MIKIRPARISDALKINVCEADCLEIWRTSMAEPDKAIARAIVSSRDAFTALLDGEIICIFGVVTSSVINGTGSPWLLGSDLIKENPFEFLGRSKKYMAKLKEGYSKLENHVDVDNKVSILWLRWLGFKISKDAKPYGIVGKPFKRFTMGLDYV